MLKIFFEKMLQKKLDIFIECGNARLSIEKLIEVADLFHVTLDYLILGRRFSNKYIDLFPDTLIHSLQTGTEKEIDLFQQYIQMFNKIYSSQKNNDSK